jgi:hypothetical protein
MARMVADQRGSLSETIRENPFYPRQSVVYSALLENAL